MRHAEQKLTCHTVVGPLAHCEGPAKFLLVTKAGKEYPRCEIHVEPYKNDPRYKIVERCTDG